MNEDLVPYLIGIGCGVLAFVVAIPLLSIPPSFPPFAIRSIGIILVAFLVSFAIADRYTGRSG